MTLRRSVAALMLAPVLAALTWGCGTIINGRSQDVLVTSVPSGATAKVGDVQVVTPGTVTLKRKETHTVVFTKEGFPDRQTSLESTGSWWLLGNAAFGGLVGLIIDLATGGGYKIVPANLEMDLATGLVKERPDASAAVAAVPPAPSSTSAGASRLRPDLADLVGTWTGASRYVDRAITGPAGPQPTIIRMYEDGEELRWALTRSSATRPDITASGVVATSEDKILLRGRYGGTGSRLGGTEVTYTLTRTDATLSGSGIGADGLLQTISVTKQAQ
jgi:hypothetical protein